ncbi:metallo-beta-lactamase [Thioclava dalianensis]|uniref:Metallo-beta-lactamase n=1 Tax=Thioclava dalianensis TaxID=1185766 RepID=A0A074T8H8_9RHOB|nr:MBL fold metallo-hydrolase [Thioclava dalianensis]KEP68019.1 metallo-beta-lactamase [Thioclava dalianensis]SFN61739.1 Glyoxylase, beta-lactamase superfamily II [Thioclava dalianensis]
MQQMESGLRRLVAPNPSPMTHTGTCTYVIGTGEVAVVDPGPDDPTHLRAILDGLDRGERVTHILVTHAHLDHSPGARALSAATGAPVHAFGPPQAGRSAIMERLARDGMVGGGEGVDHAFAPDRMLSDGETLSHGDWTLTALHTPGHFCNHLCFQLGDSVLSGDLIMGWSTTLISPPDGDLGDYFRSIDRIAALGPRRLYPGHGAPVDAPIALIAEHRQHRETRSAQILAALSDAPAMPAALTARIYHDIPRHLHAAALRNILAHLIELNDTNQVQARPALSPEAEFFRP